MSFYFCEFISQIFFADKGIQMIRKKISTLLLLLTVFPLLCQAAGIKGKVTVDGEELKDAVIYLESNKNERYTPPSKPVILDQKDLTFVPHVLPVLVGSTVAFPNSDPTRHSVFSPGKTKKFDFGTYAQGAQKSITFENPGVVPLLCHVHPEMSAFIVVVETPYFAVSDENGYYQIKNVPKGKYKIIIWHEWAKPQSRTIDVDEGKDLNINFSLDE